jgi:hypothetical protein
MLTYAGDVSISFKIALMKQGSTVFLRGVIALIGTVVLIICLFVLPPAIMSEMSKNFDYGFIFLGLYVSAIPFFYALYQALNLLGSIDQNTAFSKSSVQALKRIKICAIIISALFAISMPYIFYVANKNNMPGIVVIDMVIIFFAIVIATFAAVLQRLLQSAAEIKSENDLMI